MVFFIHVFGVFASEIKQEKMAVGCHIIENRRKKNCEDCLFAQTFHDKAGCVAGVFDGHGGGGVAHFLKKNMPHALRELYAEDKIDASSLVHLFTTLEQEVSALAIKGNFLQFSADYSAGSTAVVVVICKGTITVAWVGDSRAVIACKDGSVSATTDHIAGSAYAYNLLKQRKQDSEYINFSLKTVDFQKNFRIYHNIIMLGKKGQKKPNNFDTYEDILAFFASFNIKTFSSIRLNRCLIPCKTFGDISPFTKKKASFSAEPDIMQFLVTRLILLL